MSIFNQVSGFVNGIASGFMGGSQQPAAAADEIIHSPSPLAGSITDPI